ncbi:MAG: DUF4956 domain-containing protein [Candidatus Omnitrophota bacterium]
MNVFLEKLSLAVSKDLSVLTIIFTLAISFFLGLFICFIYKRTHRGFSSASSFTFTLIMINVIVSVIMMVIGSNIALSLGLIGSLSIIRFRTVIKDTKDMAYLFWVIAEGLAVGSGNYLTAAVSAFFIGCFVIILTKINFDKTINSDYIMVLYIDLQLSLKAENMIRDLFSQKNIKYELRSSFTDSESKIKEITYSLHAKVQKDSFEQMLSVLNNINGIKKVSLLTPEHNFFV